MRRFLAGADLFTGSVMLHGHGVLLDGALILEILPDDASVDAEIVRLPEASLLVPGFIDAQVNGGGGVLVNDATTAEAVRTVVAAHRRYGTTGLLPTIVTDTPERMRAAVDAVAEAAREPGGGVLGVHLEGPFISRERRGVHKADLVRSPDAADLAFLEALPARFPGGRVLVSLAPEIVDDAAIRRLADAGLVVAAAHSAASFERICAAVDAGLRGFTHLFNAMPPIAGRQPGIAAAALATPDTWCGIIADGIHVHPALLRLAIGAKPDRIFLVTDAMPPLGTEARSFTFYGATIHRQDGRLATGDGTLAGADLDMAEAVRNGIGLLGVGREQALRMASLHPARFLGLADRRGRIAPGCIADLTVLDARLSVLGTWVAGAWLGAAP
jgi:N-acetylglucosamine-6-phosphate deacetylase